MQVLQLHNAASFLFSACRQRRGGIFTVSRCGESIKMLIGDAMHPSGKKVFVPVKKMRCAIIAEPGD